MIPEIGQFSLAIALGFALVQSVLPMVGAARGNVLLMRSAHANDEFTIDQSSTNSCLTLHQSLFDPPPIVV